MFFVPPIVYLRVGGQTTVAGWMGWVKIWQFLEGYGMRVRCAFCFLDLVKWALAIGISARRKKTRTMTRSLVVLSVIFILTKCRWEDDVLNFFRTCKQKMRRSESQGPKSQKVFLRGRVSVGVGGGVNGFQRFFVFLGGGRAESSWMMINPINMIKIPRKMVLSTEIILCLEKCFWHTKDTRWTYRKACFVMKLLLLCI